MTRTGTWTTPVGERAAVAACAAIALALLASPALAQPPCPAGTVLTATVVLVDGTPALPNSITIHPDGSGQTLASRGLAIDVCVDCSGAPLVGAPAAELTLSGAGVYICGPGPIADAPTDAAGCTTFTGTIFGGGCSATLDVNVGATLVGTVAVAIRSPDAPSASPGFVDAADLSSFAASFPSAIGSPTFSLASTSLQTAASTRATCHGSHPHWVCSVPRARDVRTGREGDGDIALPLVMTAPPRIECVRCRVPSTEE